MIEILSYFDLNKRATRGERNLQVVTRPSDAKVRYKIDMPPSSLDVEESPFLRAVGLGNKYTPTSELPPQSQMPLWEQLLMYFAIMIGVIFSSAVMQFKSGEVDITGLTTAKVLISAIVAFVIAPVAFEKLTVMTDAPLLARLGLFVQHGVFWSVLFGSIP